MMLSSWPRRWYRLIITLLILVSPPPSYATLQVTDIQIGVSSAGRPLTAVKSGDGLRKFVLVGHTHGESEANTYHLATQLADYFRAHPAEVPAVPDGVVDFVSREDRWAPNVDSGATCGGLVVAIIGGRYYDSHLSQRADGMEPGNVSQPGNGSAWPARAVMGAQPIHICTSGFPIQLAA